MIEIYNGAFRQPIEPIWWGILNDHWVKFVEFNSNRIYFGLTVFFKDKANSHEGILTLTDDEETLTIEWNLTSNYLLVEASSVDFAQMVETILMITAP